MKRFLARGLLFLLLIFILSILLSQIDFSDAFIIYKTRDTEYKKIAWNINLITKKQERLDGSIIVLGSSIVQGGLNDSLLQEKGLNVINMGVPHNGDELSLYFLNRLKEKHPKAIVLLKGKTQYRNLHKLTPLLYTPSRLLEAGQSINLDFVIFIFKRTKLSLEYLFSMNVNNSDSELNEFLNASYGVIYDENEISDETYNKFSKGDWARSDEYFNLRLNNFLYQSEQQKGDFIKSILKIKRKMVSWFLMDFSFLSNTKSQRSFMNKAVREALKYNIEVRKIYIPILIDVKEYTGYNRQTYPMVSSDTIGILILDSHKFLNKQAYWSDESHLNEKGSILFTEKMIKHFDSLY